MNLGILFPPGSGLFDLEAQGQSSRFIKYYLANYCQNFSKVFVFSYEKKNYPGLPKNSWEVLQKISLHRYIYALLLPLLNWRMYKQCDVFRCFHPSAAIPAIIGKLFFGKKFIFNYNYDYIKWAKVEGKSYLVPLLFFQQWLAFIFCNGVFVSDKKMEEYACKFVSSSKIKIIPNGVDSSLFKPLPKITRKKEKIILSIGRLETQKNYGQLIEAVSKLKKRTKLIIVGKGSLKEELIRTALKLKIKLEIIDMIPNNQLPGIYNSADVYVQPSLMEAPVKTLLEAMSCGIPCVATNVTGIRDLITHGENGLLADLNTSDLSNKISEMLSSDTEAKKMSLNAKKLVEEKYNLLKFVEIEILTLSAVVMRK